MTLVQTEEAGISAGVGGPPDGLAGEDYAQRTAKGGAASRVLLADPDTYLLRYYRRELAAEGFQIAVATDGIACVQRLREFRPEVLVLEPMLPWGGGDGVIVRMHEDPDLPVVSVFILTSGCPASVLYHMAPYRIADYQFKPMSAARLAERLRLIVAPRSGPVLRGQKGGF